MAEYIEREAFKAEVQRLSTHYLNEWDTLGVLAAAGRIPAAEVRPVEWIPATERLPEDWSDILAVQSYCGEVRIIPANYDRGVWYDCVFNRVAEHITHWMPLPPAPKEE